MNPQIEIYRQAAAEIKAVLDKYGLILGEDYGNSYIGERPPEAAGDFPDWSQYHLATIDLATLEVFDD